MDKSNSLWVYHKLDFLKKYHFKFLFVAFVGVHVPLIGIIIYLVSADQNTMTPLGMGLLTLILTLVATAATLAVLHELLKPLKLIQKGLEAYIERAELPAFPENYQDEVGQLMAKLQQTLKQLQELLDEKQDMLSLLSHDLRSPVNQIKGLIEVLEEPDLEEELRIKYLKVMDELCDRHGNLLNDVLLMLKHEHKAVDQHGWEEIQLLPLLQVCNEELRHHLGKKELSISLKTSISQVVTRANKTMFQQVFRNLIENAIKFSFPKGHIEVRIEIAEPYLLIHIKDGGIGFEPEIAAQLFDKFTKKGRKGTLNEPSTGLGLHLSRKIIEQHGGKLEAFSEGKDKGATFTISLTQWAQGNPAAPFSTTSAKKKEYL